MGPRRTPRPRAPTARVPLDRRAAEWSRSACSRANVVRAAHAINDAGEIVADVIWEQATAVLWTPTGMPVDLGPSSQALLLDINDRGELSAAA